LQDRWSSQKSATIKKQVDIMDRNIVCTGGRALRIAVGITMLILVLAGGAGAATITVDDSGGAMYTRIQQIKVVV